MNISRAADFVLGYMPLLSSAKIIGNVNESLKGSKEKSGMYAIAALSLSEDVYSLPLLLAGPSGWGLYALNKTAKNLIGESVIGDLDPLNKQLDRAKRFAKEGSASTKRLLTEK